MEYREKQKQLSCDVSKALDAMKYGYNDIKTRVQMYKIWQDVNREAETPWIAAGSRAEGVSHCEEPDNDFDFMGVFNPWICCDDLHKSDSYPGKAVLEMVTERTEPGYTMLRYKATDNNVASMEDPLIIQKCYGQLFVGHILSSDDLTISGPAYTKQYPVQAGSDEKDSDSKCENVSTNSASNVQSFSSDGVFAIPCICTEYLQKWKQRDRFTNWPGQQLIEEISQMNGHVVPVGSKGSEDSHLEWRICYTEAEVELIHSMNETQLKLYVLLKMVAKKILKPICSDISSYIIKNVLFWFVEKTPADRFKPENLLDLVEEALQTLHKSIEEEFLSNYMIPERNLLAGRLSEDVKGKLLAELHNLIHVQGPTFFLHHKDFQSLKSAVEQTRQCEAEGAHIAAEGSQQSQNLDLKLREAYEKANNLDEHFLDIVISTLSPEQIKQNISEIIFIVTY